MFNSINLICIHLTAFKSKKEFRSMLSNNNLLDLIQPTCLLSLKEQGFKKIWIDSQSLEIIAFTKSPNKKDIIFNDEYIKFMKSMKSISKDGKMISLKKENLDIDIILDKISYSGINSLTKNERIFLDNCSKK